MGAPATQSPDGDSSHGDMECHLTGGKEPELVREVQWYRLEILGLTSMHSLGHGLCSPLLLLTRLSGAVAVRSPVPVVAAIPEPGGGLWK